MGRLGSKFRNAFSPSKKPGSPIIKDPPKKHSATNHSVIDTRAVIAIRWLALAGQTIALMIVAFGFGFDGAFPTAFGLVAIGAAVNLWQSWRSRYQRVTKVSSLQSK